MKRLIVVLAVLVAGLFAPASIYAQTNLEPGVCTTVYGGGVICGAKHEVVETGIGENLALIGTLSLVASGVFLLISARSKKIEYQQGL